MKEQKAFDVKKEIQNLCLVIIACALGAFGMHVFVYPSNFAPGGVEGIATMLQSITKVNAGIYSFVLNLPLFIIAWFLLNKRYVIYTIIYIALSSILLIILAEVDMWQYVTETDKLITALFSGILLGARTGIMIKVGASSGGVDIIACAIQTKNPYQNVERLISVFSYVIMGISYFVYKDMNCILLSIVQMIVFERVIASILSSTRNAIEVKIVTKNPNEIKSDLLFVLKHGATVVESKGMFTEEDRSIVYSVINQRQMPEFLKMIKKYPDTFVYYCNVSGVYGNFRWKKDDIAK